MKYKEKIERQVTFTNKELDLISELFDISKQGIIDNNMDADYEEELDLIKEFWILTRR